jgi:hypothetical protein
MKTCRDISFSIPVNAQKKDRNIIWPLRMQARRSVALLTLICAQQNIYVELIIELQLLKMWIFLQVAACRIVDRRTQSLCVRLDIEEWLLSVTPQLVPYDNVRCLFMLSIQTIFITY